MPKPTTITTVTSGKTILALLTDYENRTVKISSADVTAVGGKKILPAGTLLGSAVEDKTILGDNAPAKAVNGAGTEGVLFYDVDVTNGDMEAAMLFVGTVDLNKLPAAPVAAVNLPRVTFLRP